MTPTTDYRILPQRLGEMADEVYNVNYSNGWFDADRSWEDGIALLHSEVSEILEAYRQWGMDDATLHPDKCLECGSDGPHSPGRTGHPFLPNKPEGVGSEAADVLVRLLDQAYREGVDIPQGHRVTSQPEVRISRWVDDLHWEISMFYKRIEKLRLDNYSESVVSHETEQGLAGILGTLEGGCFGLGIDLMAEYTRKIAYNKTRGYRHGNKRL